jgi:hypothetical protein
MELLCQSDLTNFPPGSFEEKMNEHLNLTSTEAHRRELHRQAETWRLGHANEATRQSPAAPPAPSTLVIRMARPDDHPALARLAQLDGARHLDPPLEHTRLLVAELEGEVLAALPVDGDRSFADPFRPTAPLVELLELRAAQLRVEPLRRGSWARFLRLLRDPVRHRPATAPATPGNAGMLIQRD